MRRIEKVKWTDLITNEEVLRRVDEKRTMLDEVIKRKVNGLANVMRRDGLLFDAVEGTRGLGRRKIQILDDFKKTISYGDLKDAVED